MFESFLYRKDIILNKKTAWLLLATIKPKKVQNKSKLSHRDLMYKAELK